MEKRVLVASAWKLLIRILGEAGRSISAVIKGKALDGRVLSAPSEPGCVSLELILVGLNSKSGLVAATSRPGPVLVFDEMGTRPIIESFVTDSWDGRDLSFR